MYIGLKFVFFRLLKKSSVGLVLSGGRNFLGRICVYHRGGGSKVKYLFIDRFRRLGLFGKIFKIFRRKSFTAFIGLIFYDNGLLSFILLSHGLKVGSMVYSGINLLYNKDFNVGSTGLLSNFGLFSVLNSIEFSPFSGFKLVRSAGCSAYLIEKLRDNKVIIKLNSGWQLKVSSFCVSSLGCCSNPDYNFISFKKAGIVRSLGIRPTVRGVIKNPCDHPHGGGEGKGSPPPAQRSPWGC